MPLPTRTTPGKPLVPGPITVTPTPPGGTPPPQTSPPDQGPPIVGGDPGNVPVPPRARIAQGLISCHGIGDGQVALVIALPDNRTSASVMPVAEAGAKIQAMLPMIAPGPQTSLGKSAMAAEVDEHGPVTLEDLMAQSAYYAEEQAKQAEVILAEIRKTAAPVEAPASLPKTFWDILRFANDSEWPPVPGAPEQPANVSYEPLNGWRSVEGNALQVLDGLTVNDAGNVNALCVRAWLGIGLLGRTGGDWADLLWRRSVVREVLAGNLPEIESLIPTGEKDRVLWGILEGEVEIEAGFGARVHDQIQMLFPAVPDGSGKSKSFAEVVAAKLARLGATDHGGEPGGPKAL